MISGTIWECPADRFVQLCPTARETSRTTSYQQRASQVILILDWYVMSDSWLLNILRWKLLFCRHLEANKTTKHSISLATHPLPEVMSLNIRKSCKHQHWKDFYCLCLSYLCTFSSGSQLFFKLISTGSNALFWNRGRQRRGYDHLRLRNHSPAGTRHPCLLVSHLSTEVHILT